MRKILMLSALVMALSLPVHAEGSIASADLMRAVAETEDGAKAKSELEKEFKKKQALLDKKKGELDKLKADFDKQTAVMKPEVRQVKELELQKKFAEAQKTAIDMQQEIATREQELIGGILKKMETILQAIGKEQGYEHILNKSNQTVLYSKASLDLTNEVIRRYNLAYGKKKG